MVFSTHLFLFYFLTLTLALYYALPRRGRNLLLTVLSYVFYGWANPIWVVLMFVSSIIDYICGLVLVRAGPGGPLKSDGWQFPFLPKGEKRSRAQRIALIVSMVSNLSLLGFFKYFDFAAENINAMAQVLGLGSAGVTLLYIALPVGISFYTFQSMSYSIDIYRGEARALRNFPDFLCYVAMFPQLVAGPIVRYHDVAEQMLHRSHTWEKFARGAAFFSIGMAKKILIANPMGHIADAAFRAGDMHWYDAWWGIVGYAFQIYFDFSAYSDMAVGLGLMFGFAFIENFHAPYRAESITDFWRRWHISLSTWLRDYLYIPLGGNRKGDGRTYINLALVMLLGGLWHGASWNFVIWGAIHGGMLAFERVQGKDSPYRALPAPVKIAITFAIVCISWVFFRAKTLPEAVAYLGSMFGLSHPTSASELVAPVMYTPYHVAMMVVAAVVVWAGPLSWDFTRRLSPARASVCLGLFALAIVMMWTQTENPFLYFQF